MTNVLTRLAALYKQLPAQNSQREAETRPNMGSTERSANDWIRASEVYKVPRTTLHDPMNRKVRVITIGAGVSGV
jgi:hypothetical protein